MFCGGCPKDKIDRFFVYSMRYLHRKLNEVVYPSLPSNNFHIGRLTKSVTALVSNNATIELQRALPVESFLSHGGLLLATVHNLINLRKFSCHLLSCTQNYTRKSDIRQSWFYWTKLWQVRSNYECKSLGVSHCHKTADMLATIEISQRGKVDYPKSNAESSAYETEIHET